MLFLKSDQPFTEFVEIVIAFLGDFFTDLADFFDNFIVHDSLYSIVFPHEIDVRPMIFARPFYHFFRERRYPRNAIETLFTANTSPTSTTAVP